jgi:phosphate transport system ATP-binding protein
MDSHISVRDLKVSINKTQVLNNVSLDIPRNQITAILGPSGCGKTTLLRSMNRFLELSDDTRISGQVMLDGVNIYDPGVDVTEIRTRIGLLAQRPYSLPMSIYENVAYGLRIHRVNNSRNLKPTIKHYLELAGLWDEVKNRLHDPATSLSIGQQQRLCLARGIALEPEVILADEPTSALDPISAQHIERRLMELKEKYTIVLVTHTLRQARRLADYVAYMYLGDVVECGPAKEVFENPREERTKAYLHGDIG